MEPVLTKYIGEPNSYSLDFFLKHEGYQGLKKALAMEPAALIDLVKAYGLRARGPAVYDAGAWTALSESLQATRAQPRITPPFPAVAGPYNCPTAVNNVETLCNLPPILINVPEWFAKLGPEKNGGPKLYCISGHVKKPGTYEASMH